MDLTCNTCGEKKDEELFPRFKLKDGGYGRRFKCNSCTQKTAFTYRNKLSPIKKQEIYQRQKDRGELKNKPCKCTFCGVTYFQTARYLRVIKNKKLNMFCSSKCSGKHKSGENSPFFKTNNWQYQQYVELNEIRDFDEVELKYSISKAKYLIGSKPYFRGQNLCAETAISDAYIKMEEKGWIYTRRLFYLLIWNSLSKERYNHIKSNPTLYRMFLDRQNEYQAIARFNMKTFYLNRLFTKKKNPIDINTLEDNPDMYLEKRNELKEFREKNRKVLKGERLIFETHILPNVNKLKTDTYEMKHG